MVILAFLTAVCALAPAVVSEPHVAAVSDVAFHVEELLVHPRPDGVDLTLVPAVDAELFVEYGVRGGPPRRSAERSVTAGTPVRFALRDLPPDAEIGYRVVARPPGGEWTPRAPQAFRTLAGPGEPVTFGISADSHAYAVWTRYTCKPVPDVAGYERLVRTLDRMGADAALDFVVVGGDDVMTHCNAGCKACDVDGVFAGEWEAKTLEQVRLRYRKTWGPELFGRVGRTKPLFYVLGNHDGEAGYGTNPCDGHSPALLDWSEQTRLEYFPHPRAGEGGAQDGLYHSVVTGDVLLVFLDVMRFTPTLPSDANGWTLGQAQTDWFIDQVMRAPQPYKFVFLEHLVGGVTSNFSCGHYGRGSLRSTETGEPDAPFLGEQALVQEVLRRAGVQVVFLFHDHVAAVGEKVGLDGAGQGVVYATCGQIGSNVPPWSEEGWYRKTMDFDGDGTAEFLTDTTGTTKRGYFRVSVDAEAALVEYVGTVLDDPALDGEVVFSFEVTP